MKNIILFIVLLAGMPCCQTDVLDLTPPDRLATSNFWKTEADAKAGLTACYGFLKDGYFPSSWEGLSDDGYNQYPWDSDVNAISTSGPTPNTGGFVISTYRRNYQAIAAINNFLTNVVSIPMDDAVRKRHVAEASFLRAFFYFQLAHLYGDVVLMTEPAFETFKEPRKKSDRTEVLAQVHLDLDNAIAGLPNEPYKNGHAVRGTAQAFKARVLLYQQKYTEAAALSKMVMDGGLFSLWNKYAEIFYKPGQTNNPEILFSVMNLPPNSIPWYGADLWLGAWQSIQPTRDLVNAYETLDGSPVDPANPYTNRDPRLKMTIFVPGAGSADGWNNYDNKPAFVPFQGPNTTGFAVRKALDPTVSNPGYSTQSSQDFVLIRYAEVLLNYAEAENAANGPANAYAAINAIRKRAGMPELPVNLSKDEMTQRIRHERRVELALENFRYYDLRRWGIATQKLNGFEVVPGNTNLKKKFYKDLFDKWPIPQGDVNQGVEQHTGY